MVALNTILVCIGWLLFAQGNLESHESHRHSFDQVIHNFLELQVALDAVAPRASQVGHIGWFRNKSMYFWSVARYNSVKKICEVGFGNGYSSVLFLTAAAESTVLSRYHDQGAWLDGMPKTQTAGRRAIEVLFPRRFKAFPGYSDETVPKFINNNPGYKCDLILIDGSHASEPAYMDIKNFKPLAHNNTILLFDDVDWPGIMNATNTAIAEKIIAPWIECINGEVLVDSRFARPGITKKDRPLTFCQTKYTP